jgi:transposase
MTSNAKAEGRFGKQDFRYVAGEDVYICPAVHQTTRMRNGLVLRRYCANASPSWPIKDHCATGKERRIRRRALNQRLRVDLDQRANSRAQA